MSATLDDGQEAVTSCSGVSPSHFISSVARWNSSQAWLIGACPGLPLDAWALLRSLSWPD
jgi:hypothetical protein